MAVGDPAGDGDLQIDACQCRLLLDEGGRCVDQVLDGVGALPGSVGIHSLDGLTHHCEQCFFL